MANDPSLSEQRALWIQCYCWFYEALSDEQQREFSRLLDVFLEEMKFVGVGIEITEEIKIAVGGWAVLLVLNRPLTISWYRSIERISIYPGRTLDQENVLGLLADGSHYSRIHLAWEDVRDFSTKATVARNTILHEFAHSLDHVDRNINGKPSLLLGGGTTGHWDQAFSPDYVFDRPASERNQLWEFFGLGAWRAFDPDDPGCVDVAELFAVATEFFFECPAELKERTGEIYDCLALLYRFDPVNDFPKKRSLRFSGSSTETAFSRPRWQN